MSTMTKERNVQLANSKALMQGSFCLLPFFYPIQIEIES